MNKIIDAHALLKYLEKEDGHEKVGILLYEASSANRKVLMTSVNLGEVYYIILREYGAVKAQEIEKVVSTLPLSVIDADWSLAKEAAKFKATCKMSYADCFAAALAKAHKGEVVTGDKEFKQVEAEVKVLWI